MRCSTHPNSVGAQPGVERLQVRSPRCNYPGLQVSIRGLPHQACQHAAACVGAECQGCSTANTVLHSKANERCWHQLKLTAEEINAACMPSMVKSVWQAL